MPNLRAPLALSLLLLAAASPLVAAAPPSAVGRAAPRAPSEPVMLYLPLIGRNNIPGYIPPFGVAFYHGLNNAAGLAHMQAAGAHWTSTYFRWAHIEPNAPLSGTRTYNWTPFDTKVANAAAAGMGVYAMFSWNPSWAAVLAGGQVTNTADLLAIVSAAAERYDGDGFQDAPGSPVVQYWAFYMEPDNFWLSNAVEGDRGFWGHEPEAYADLLASVSTAMRAANPNVIVLPGAVAYDFFGDPDGNGSFKKDFLGRVIDRLNVLGGGHGRATNYIGAIGFHYYPISPGLWSDIHEKAQEIRGIMNARGVGHLPLLVPEMGYWSEPVPPPLDPMSSSPTLQAQRLPQMYLHGLSQGLQQMDWFQVFDGTCCSPLETHGLFYGANLNDPKPAYQAYTTLVREMTGAFYVGPVSGPGLQGYVFSMWKTKTKWAVWATQSSAQHAFPLTCLRRVDYMGNEVMPILDGNPTWDKDAVSGQITLEVAHNNVIYVEGC